MIAPAQQLALQQFIRANILSPILTYADYGPDLAVVSAAVALACRKRRVQTNPLAAIVDAVASAFAKAKG